MSNKTDNIYDYSGKEKEIDEADKYKTSYARKYEPPSASLCCRTCVDVLHPIWGKPWNNLALAYVHTLRPSSIRVVSNGCITTDFYSWRVTVYLEADGRTIQKVEQEVEVCGIGINTGSDFRYKLSGKPLPAEFVAKESVCRV